MVTAMSSNENPDQEIERVLQAHFESEAEGLKAPTDLWGRIQERLREDLGRGDMPPVWQRLVRPVRWGLSPALAAMALLILAVSGTWLFTATPWQNDGATELALQPGARRIATYATATPAPAAAPAATAAPAPTAAPAAARPAGARGPAGAAGPAGPAGSAAIETSGAFTVVTEEGGNLSTESFYFLQPQATPSQPPLPAANTSPRGQLETVQRQVISQGSVSLDVEDVPSATVQVRLIAESAGGFVEQLSSQGVEERQQSTMTIRIPQPEFFNVFDRIKLLGKVLNENAGSEDVTERFIDLEARLKSAAREELSLLSLLERAEKVSEILTIERELSRIRTELEQVQGQINFLERRVDLATIIVALFPPQFRAGQPPSASFSLEVSDVSQRVEELKALVSPAGGEFDQVFTTVQNGAERANMTVRVFAKDFNRVVSAIESMGKVTGKEVREGTGLKDSEATAPEDPDSRIDVSFFEREPFREGQPPSASLSLEVSNVSQRVEAVKALVSAAGGEFDQVFTSVQDGTERASLTVRVFAQDFNRVVSAIESQGKIKGKEVREGIGPKAAETDVLKDPDSRIDVSFVEQEPSNTGRWVVMGAAAAVVILGFLFYVTYQIGQRRGETE